MEIFTGQINQVPFKGQHGWTVEAQMILDCDATNRTWLDVTEDGSTGVFNTTLPYLVDERDVDIEWTLIIPDADTVVKTQKLDVVTQILSIDEVKPLVRPTPSDDAANAIERSVRLIINAHCGQTFGTFVGTKTVSGNGESFLRLPKRIISLSTINGLATTGATYVRGGGWYVRTQQFDFPPPVRADLDGWNELTAQFGSILSFGFNLGTEYIISGVWGYSEVPEAVREAARLLVDDYTQMDIAYRDRYLSNTSAADWRVAFNAGAYLETGNVRADQLLQEFVMPRGWVVI